MENNGLKSLKWIFLFLVLHIGYFSNADFASYSPQELYHKLELESSISFPVFQRAQDLNRRYKQYQNYGHGIYSIIDFSKASNVRRLVVIDSDRNKVLMREYVSHGRNTGQLNPIEFSNNINSHQSSLGVYKTAETYNGKFGYSLKLDGISKSNSNARKRYIVMHPADYSSESFLSKNGYLGRSWGCPSVDPKISKKLINLIKGGTNIYAFN